MMWVLGSGAPWRDLPERYGNWNSVFVRYRRWCKQGIFDALLETLVEVGIADEWKKQMVDSTIVRGRSQAAGAKGGTKRGDQSQGFGRSRGGFTSKIHLRAYAIGRPIAFEITGGEPSDIRHLEPLMDDPVDVPTPKVVLGDKGYDSDSNREALLLRGILPVIPSKRSRKVVIPHDETVYKDRNRIERMINKLKQNRRIAMRFDKTKLSFAGFITLAFIKLWLPTFVNRAWHPSAGSVTRSRRTPTPKASRRESRRPRRSGYVAPEILCPSQGRELAAMSTGRTIDWEPA